MRYGYARISTDEQERSLQFNALRKAGVDEKNIVQETINGTSNPRMRPLLSRLLADLQPGDELVVWRLDRLGRSASDLFKIDRALRTRQVKLLSLFEGIDTSVPAGELFRAVLESLTHMERMTVIERVNAGIAVAKAKGRKFGRPRKLKDDVIRKIHTLRKSGESVASIAEAFDMTSRSVYRALAITPASPDTQITIPELAGLRDMRGEIPIAATPPAELRRYRYDGKIIGVCKGLGGDCYFVGWDTGGGSHRVKSRALPVCGTAEEAQKHLDTWAQSKKLKTE